MVGCHSCEREDEKITSVLYFYLHDVTSLQKVWRKISKSSDLVPQESLTSFHSMMTSLGDLDQNLARAFVMLEGLFLGGDDLPVSRVVPIAVCVEGVEPDLKMRAMEKYLVSSTADELMYGGITMGATLKKCCYCNVVK